MPQRESSPHLAWTTQGETNLPTNTPTKRSIVRLNVGGIRYDVSLDTLERCDGSKLMSLLSDHWRENSYDEPLFIDRNGLLFQYVLDFLRTYKLCVPPSVSQEGLNEELKYYGIDAEIARNNGKYGLAYLRKLNEEICTLEDNLELCRGKVRAVEASMFIDIESSQRILPTSIEIPDAYLPFDMYTLQSCSYLNGLHVTSASSPSFVKVAEIND